MQKSSCLPSVQHIINLDYFFKPDQKRKNEGLGQFFICFRLNAKIKNVMIPEICKNGRKKIIVVRVTEREKERERLRERERVR